jgi:hypothetical protein
VLNKTNESDLRLFVENMYKAVKTRAVNTLPNSVLHGEQAVIAIEFQVQKDGSLGHSAPLTIVGNSGKKVLEKHAQAAIRSAAPFGALPISSPAPLQLRLTFYYNTPPPETSGCCAPTLPMHPKKSPGLSARAFDKAFSHGS